MPNLYDTDFYAWTVATAQLLRERDFEKVDWDNLIEEIETLGRSERQQLLSRLEILLGHLLKWQYQRDRHSHSWEATIREQRRKIERLLKDNPSLRPFLLEAIALGYEDAIDLAVRETNLPYTKFPKACPYHLEQVLDFNFLP